MKLNKQKKVLKLLVLVMVLSALIIGYFGFVRTFVPSQVSPLTPTGSYRIKITPGNISNIVGQFNAQGLKASWLEVQVLSRLLLISKKLKPGVYDFPPGASLGKVLWKLGQGDSVRLSVTLIEGWTFDQFKTAVNQQPELVKVYKTSSPVDILKGIGAKERHPEGLFYPDTYLYEPGDSDEMIYKKAYQAMTNHLDKAWNQTSDRSQLKSAYELLKLASIIEKETGKREDQKLIAAVFHNRLKLGMKLQTDPTVIYGMGSSFDGNLRKRDLLKDGPYNTYTRKGLPPTPICMPGKDALIAASKPAESKVLYFVAKGDGNSHFSETLSAHERAVSRYQLGK